MLSGSLKVPYCTSEWDQLKLTLSQQDVNLTQRDMRRTTLQHRCARGCIEAVKYPCKKELIRLDTDDKMNGLKQVLGSSVMLKPLMASAVRAPAKHPRLGKVTWNHSFLNQNNIINTLVGLEPTAEEAQGAFIARTTSRGVDLRYDPIAEELQVNIRFSSVPANSPEIMQELGLAAGDLQLLPPAAPLEDENNQFLQVGLHFSIGETTYMIEDVNEANVAAREVDMHAQHNTNNEHDDVVVEEVRRSFPRARAVKLVRAYLGLV